MIARLLRRALLRYRVRRLDRLADRAHARGFVLTSRWLRRRAGELNLELQSLA